MFQSEVTVCIECQQRPIKARGLCHACYQRRVRNGKVLGDERSTTCLSCSGVRRTTLEAHCSSCGGPRDKHNKTGLCFTCYQSQSKAEVRQTVTAQRKQRARKPPKACVDCGAPIDRKATRCVPCAYQQRRVAERNCACGAVIKASSLTGKCQRCRGKAKPAAPAAAPLRKLVLPPIPALKQAPRPKAPPPPKPVAVVTKPIGPECPTHHTHKVLLTEVECGTLFVCASPHCSWSEWADPPVGRAA